jgi:hypothetical protein
MGLTDVIKKTLEDVIDKGTVLSKFSLNNNVNKSCLTIGNFKHYMGFTSTTFE